MSETMEQKGIKETLELLDLVEQLGKVLQSAKEDGKLNWMDLPKFAPLIVAGKRAVDGGKFIAAEIKDLDANEVGELTSKLIAAVTALVAGVTAG